MCWRSLLKCNTCQIFIISCPQELALWVWLNMSMWMGSGRNSNDTYKVWCILYNVHSSYKHFIFPGEGSKWWPCHAHTVTRKRNILITFNPKGVKSTHDDFHHNPRKIPRRSTLNSNAYTLPKMTLFWKCSSSSWFPVDLKKKSKCKSVSFGMLCMPTKIHQARSNHWFFMNVWKFLGGAVVHKFSPWLASLPNSWLF